MLFLSLHLKNLVQVFAPCQTLISEFIEEQFGICMECNFLFLQLAYHVFQIEKVISVISLETVINNKQVVQQMDEDKNGRYKLQPGMGIQYIEP